jgi:hypothetical protein
VRQGGLYAAFAEEQTMASELEEIDAVDALDGNVSIPAPPPVAGPLVGIPTPGEGCA